MQPKPIYLTLISVLLIALSSHIAYAASPDNGGSITQGDLVKPVTDFPVDLVSGANETQLANYAWRLFIAATQQTTATISNGQGRAMGNGKNNFIDTGKSPGIDNPLVFESFYHRTEAFPFYTSQKPPSPIQQAPVYHTFYADDKGNTVPLTVAGQNYVYLDETNQISQNFLYYQHSYAPDFPVLFMAKVNQLEATYALDPARQAPSPSNSWDFPDGVVEVKAAWRRVKDIKNSNPQTYHQASATYFIADASGTPTVHTDTFALIGLHIIQKTTNYQEFIFTTFEHVDAVTRDSNNNIIDPAYKTTYNNLSYQTPSSDPHTATVTGAYSINAPGQPSQQNKQTTYNLPKAGAISQDYTTVVQPNTIIKEVNDVNNQVHSLITNLDKNNIWANYRLKGVQAVPTSDTTASNYFLANIVVESSQPGIQLFTGILLNGGVPEQGVADKSKQYFVNCRGDIGNTKCIYPDPALNTSPPPTTYNNVSLNVQQSKPVPPAQFSMGGCQGCHGAAQQLGRDFSFLPNGVGGKGKELDAVPASALSVAQKEAINRRMIESSGFDLR